MNPPRTGPPLDPPPAAPATPLEREPLRARIWMYLRERKGKVIVVLWVLALALAYWAVIEEFRLTGRQTRSALDPVYRALQLFVMDDSMVASDTGIRSWQFELARLVAPVLSGYTAAVALLLLFHEQVAALLVRFRRGHTVLCGLGRHGLDLVSDLQRQGRHVVVIEINPDNENIIACRQEGATVLVGDATEELVLVRARIGRASRIVALTGDDGANVEIALVARHLLARGRVPGRGPGECLVHVTDSTLRSVLDQHFLLDDAAAPFDAKLFNVYESGVRLLFERHPLDGEGTTADESTRVNLVVIGCGRMGESVVLHAARTAYYANGRSARVTVVDRAAFAKRQSLMARYPGLDRACELDFIEGDVFHQEVLAGMVAELGRADLRSTVVIAFDNDSAALACAIQIRAWSAGRDVAVRVRMSEDGGLSMLFENGGTAAAEMAGMTVFGAAGDVCTDAVLLDSRRDELAQSLHALLSPGTEWQKIGPRQRAAFRNRTDHLPVVRRALARASASGAGPELSAELLEQAARMEHARSTAVRMLGSPPCEKSAAPLAWEQLAPEDRHRQLAEARLLVGMLFPKIEAEG